MTTSFSLYLFAVLEVEGIIPNNLFLVSVHWVYHSASPVVFQFVP